MAQTSGSTPRRPKQREQQGAVGGGDHLAGSDSTNVNEGPVGRRCARNCEVQTGYLPWFPLWVSLPVAQVRKLRHHEMNQVICLLFQS